MTAVREFPLSVIFFFFFSKNASELEGRAYLNIAVKQSTSTGVFRVLTTYVILNCAFLKALFLLHTRSKQVNSECVSVFFLNDT